MFNGFQIQFSNTKNETRLHLPRKKMWWKINHENCLIRKEDQVFPSFISDFMSVLLKGDAGANKEGGNKFTSNAEYLRDIKGGGGEERKEKPKEHFPPGYVPPPEKKRKKKKKAEEVIGDTL